MSTTENWDGTDTERDNENIPSELYGGTQDDERDIDDVVLNDDDHYLDDNNMDDS